MSLFLPFCFCGAVELYGILGKIWGKMYAQRFMSIFSENTTVPSPIPTHRPPISQTAFFAHMPLNRRPVSKDMAQTAEKAGSGEEKSECLVLAQKAELFTEPGSVSGNREERFLPAFPTYHICPSEGVGGPSGMGASAVVCSPA